MLRRTLLMLLALISFNAVNVAAAQTQTYCMSLASQLFAGGQGRVTPGLPNVLRAEPTQVSTAGSGSTILAYIPAGGVFTVLSGPACNNGITWWQVEYEGVIGWTPEGQWSTYWTEAVGTITPPTPTPTVCALASRLFAGAVGRVTPGLPNRMRVDPSLNARFLRSIPAGGEFTVLTDAVCADGMVWYQVDYAGAVGWTAEGFDTEYWLEPV